MPGEYLNREENSGGDLKGARSMDWDARELLQALATGHVRIVPETPYGADLTDRIKANVKRIVLDQTGPS